MRGDDGDEDNYFDYGGMSGNEGECAKRQPSEARGWTLVYVKLRSFPVIIIFPTKGQKWVSNQNISFDRIRHLFMIKMSSF